MKTSVMDKIRILRSSRIKTNSKKGKPPSAVVKPPLAIQPAVSEASQQWVPVLVFDISQATGASVLQTIPVTASLPVTNNNPVKKSNSPKKAILVTKDSTGIISTTTRIPIMTKRISFRSSSIPDTHQIIINAGEPSEDPLALSVAESTESTVQCDKGYEIVSEKTVKCVLCDQIFFSLEDMQAHYLSTHKARRSRDTRKRKTGVENSGAQDQTNSISIGEVDQESDEPDFPVTDKTDAEPKCPVCSIAFRTEEEVKSHIKEVHSYICSECNSTFYNLFQFTSHRCSKGPRKVKRVRKKSVTVLKPEVAKVMDSFVKIQPKTKKKAKNSTVIQTTRSPPPLERITHITLPVSAVVDDAESTIFPEIVERAEISGPSVLSLAGNDVSGSEETVAVEQGEEAEQVCGTDSYMLPSITTTYTLKVPENTSDKNSEESNVQVIETSNIYEAKKLVQETKAVDTKISRTEVIREKIAQLKNNPNVSISWRPTLRIKKQDDGDFVCGRCNVLCDDMEDYMDHIQDCLHITSVTLEPTSNPPRRLLRLQYEFSSFGVWETGNNRYSVNQNLINKLKAALPQTKECNSAYSCNTKTEAMVPECTVPSQVNLTGQAFRDLVDDDYGYESHESVDVHTGGSASPVSPVAKQGGDSSSARSTRSSNGGQALQSQLGVSQSKVFVSSTKGTQPMVVIPFDSKAKFKLNVMSDQLSKNPGKCEMVENVREVLTPPNDLTSQAFRSSSSSSRAASPMGMLLDQDEIKMEVEEEVVEDHFENS